MQFISNNQYNYEKGWIESMFLRLAIRKVKKTNEDGTKNHDLEVVRSMEKDEWKKLMQTSKPLYIHEMNKNLYEMVKRNFSEFENTCNDNDPSIDDGDLLFEVNRRLLNYLSTVRTYLDHTEHKISQLFGGKESKQYQSFKELTTHAYDTYFSYRFLFKLRNFAQHVGLPLTSVSSSLENGRKFYFRRDYLLEYDGWGAQVKKELQSMPPNIEIGNHVAQMTACIGVLYFKFIEFYSDQLMSSINKLLEFQRPFNGEPIILSAPSEEAYKRGKITLHPLPYDKIQATIKDLEEHPRIEIEYI